MDNKEFDKIFSEGLKQTQSFDSAHEDWEKLQPRLHPKKEKRRILFWPFWAAALVILGSTTFWYYQKSEKLEAQVDAIQQVQELNERNNSLQNSKKNISSEFAVDLTTPEKEVESITKEEKIIQSKGIAAALEKRLTERNADLSFSNEMIKNEAKVNSNEAAKLQLITQEKLQDKSTNVSPVEHQSLAAKLLEKLIPKNVLLPIALIDNPKPTFPVIASIEKEEKNKEKQKGIWSAGAYSALGWGTAYNANLMAESLNADALSSPKRTFFNYGVQGTYIAGKNWLFSMNLGRESYKNSSDEFVNYGIQLDELDSLAGSNQFADGYLSTDFKQQVWHLGIEANRRMFSIKEIHCYGGVHASSRLFGKHSVFYSNEDQLTNGQTALKTASGSLDLSNSFSIGPVLNITASINSNLWLNLKSMFNFNLTSISSDLEIPAFGLGLGLNYNFK